MGALQIIGSFKGGGIGPFILGAINVLVGILLIGSPIAAALAVPLVFGVLLLIQGAGLIILAFASAPESSRGSAPGPIRGEESARAILISCSFQSERKGRLPFIPAENTAPGRRFAKSPSALIPGSTGSIRSTSDEGELRRGRREVRNPRANCARHSCLTGEDTNCNRETIRRHVCATAGSDEPGGVRAETA
jgi:hypothetical protein